MLHPVMFRSLWQFRGFVLGSVLREFNGRYRGSLFGAFWAVASPLAMILIYTVIFAELMRPTLPGFDRHPFAFSIYLCAGVIAWNLFAEMLVRMNGVFIENANLIKKVSFPRICLPTIVALSALINFGILLAIFLAFLMIVGHWPGWPLLALLPVLLLQMLFTVGLGIALGTLNVFFRDVGQLTGVVLQFWFWLTPIVYTSHSLPESVRTAMYWNPMVPLMAAYQEIFLWQKWPSPVALLPFAILAIVMLLIGAWLFLGRAGEIVDEL